MVLWFNMRVDYPYLHIGRAGDIQDAGDRKLYRFLEILPGLSAWLTLVLIVILSFLAPFFMALFIIAFDIYWLIKTVYLSLHLRVAYNKLRENSKISWLDKLNTLPPSSYQILNTIYKLSPGKTFIRLFSCPSIKRATKLFRRH